MFYNNTTLKEIYKKYKTKLGTGDSSKHKDFEARTAFISVCYDYRIPPDIIVDSIDKSISGVLYARKQDKTLNESSNLTRQRYRDNKKAANEMLEMHTEEYNRNKGLADPISYTGIETFIKEIAFSSNGSFSERLDRVFQAIELKKNGIR